MNVVASFAAQEDSRPLEVFGISPSSSRNPVVQRLEIGRIARDARVNVHVSSNVSASRKILLVMTRLVDFGILNVTNHTQVLPH